MTLNREQRFAENIIQQNMDIQTLMIIMGGPGTGKSTVVKAVMNIVDETVQNSTSVLRIGTTGNDVFVISRATCHSVMILPINCLFRNLKGFRLKFLHDRLYEILMMIIDEISMTGKKMLHQVDKRLRQGYGKLSETIGGFTIVLVGDFQPFSTVGETAMYQPNYSLGSLTYDTIQKRCHPS